MHGIDLYREATVKTQAAIAIQEAAGKKDSGGGYVLPSATRHPELQEANVIETRMVIRQKEEELWENYYYLPFGSSVFQNGSLSYLSVNLTEKTKKELTKENHQ